MKIKELIFLEESTKMVVYELTYTDFWGKERTIKASLDKFCDTFAKRFDSGNDIINSHVAERIKHQYLFDTGKEWDLCVNRRNYHTKNNK